MGKIFILDDEIDLVTVMCQLISFSLKTQCICATSFEETKKKEADVLATTACVLDINLGHGRPSGIDVYRWLREKNYRGKIVFLTGHAAEHPVVRAAAALSGTKILEKPVDISEIKELLAQRE